MTEARINKYYRNQVINLFLLAIIVGIMVYLFVPTKEPFIKPAPKTTETPKKVVKKTIETPQKVVQKTKVIEKIVVKKDNVKTTEIKKKVVKVEPTKKSVIKCKPKKIVKKKMKVLDFKPKFSNDKNTYHGNMILAKGSNAVIKPNTKITGNLYILNVKSPMKLPKGLKVEGHIFVKDSYQVSFPSNMKVNGNIYIYGDTGLHTIPQTAKIDGQLYI